MFRKTGFLRRTVIGGLLLGSILFAQNLVNACWAGDSSVLAGVEVGSFLKPAAKVDVWFAGSGSGLFRDLVMGAAAGRHGAEVSLGLGATCSDGDHHVDLRGIVSRYRGQTSVGAEFLDGMAEASRKKFVMLLNVDRALGAATFQAVAALETAEAA